MLIGQPIQYRAGRCRGDVLKLAFRTHAGRHSAGTQDSMFKVFSWFYLAHCMQIQGKYV